MPRSLNPYPKYIAKAYDTDGDGKVSRQEALSNYKAANPKSGMEETAETIRNFFSHDKDGDGLIDVEEIIQVFWSYIDENPAESSGSEVDEPGPDEL